MPDEPLTPFERRLQMDLLAGKPTLAGHLYLRWIERKGLRYLVPREADWYAFLDLENNRSEFCYSPHYKGAAMNARVRRTQLIETLKKNRDNHRALFLQALQGFQKEAVQVLQDRLDKARRGEPEDVRVFIEMPTDQTKDYNRTITMMEMDTRDEIELTEQEFARYVMDDWGWKDQWLASNTKYLSNR